MPTYLVTFTGGEPLAVHSDTPENAKAHAAAVTAIKDPSTGKDLPTRGVVVSADLQKA